LESDLGLNLKGITFTPASSQKALDHSCTEKIKKTLEKKRRIPTNISQEKGLSFERNAILMQVNMILEFEAVLTVSYSIL
jgi:hypothetical protein